MTTLRTTHPLIFWTVVVPVGLLAAFIMLLVALAIAENPNTSIGVIVLLVAYWVPTIVAARRRHQVGLVAVLNALLGWTVIAWVVALAIACGDRRPRVVEVRHAPGPQS